MWLIMVSALMVSHVDWDGCMKGWKEVVGTCECKDERNGHTQATKYAETNDTEYQPGVTVTRIILLSSSEGSGAHCTDPWAEE